MSSLLISRSIATEIGSPARKLLAGNAGAGNVSVRPSTADASTKFSDGGRFTVANAPLDAVKLMKLKLDPTAGTKPPKLFTLSVPARLAVPFTLIQSYPLPFANPPISIVNTLDGPSVRLPLMMMEPGEKPGAMLALPITTLPFTVPG